MNKAGKIKVGAGVAKARAATGKTTRNRQSAETKLAELKRRLLDISDLVAAGAVLRWDQSTYMPRGGALARAGQRATLSRLAHEKSTRHWGSCSTTLRHMPLACLMIRMKQA
jgi:carboxypeptidase Taq (M32) metallopeptidase